jgi:hypothetical protein
MARALGLAVAFLLLLSAAAASARGEPSGELVAGAEETVLRLHDLPPGYQIDDDSICDQSSPGESAASRLDRWIARHRPAGCFYEYERVFEIPAAAPTPPLVVAQTINTPSERAAIRGFELYNRLLTRFGDGNDRGRVALSPNGPSARLIRLRGLLVEGKKGRRGSFLFWRQGKLIAVVQVAGLNPRGNDRVALHLAQVQQRRLEAPTPYPEAERDDTEVPLDDPGLKFPIYWVGSDFDPGAGLPTASLAEASAGQAGPPGEKVALWYEGFNIAAWTRQGWRRFQHSALGEANRTAPCTRTAEVELEGGRATVYAAYGSGPRACLSRPPHRYYAIAHIGRMVLGVNLALCAKCAPGYGSSPYNSLRAMKAILRALTLRPKPVY